LNLVAMVELVFAVLFVILSGPVFLDLLLALAGNLWVLVRPGTRVSATLFDPAAGQVAVFPLAVVIPAHNEEVLVAGAVASLRRQSATTPIYVVAHNCTDATAAIAIQAGATVVLLNDPQSWGKAAALRHGFAAALANGALACLVLDADSVASENLLTLTCQAFVQGAAATQCRYEQQTPPGQPCSLVERLRLLAFRGMNVVRARGRAALGFSAGIFGNGFALSSATLQQVPYNADGIAEDVEYHVHLVAAGLRVTWLEAARVFADLAPAGAVQTAQQARWEGGRLSIARTSAPLLLAAFLRGNLRAGEALLDVWSLPLSSGLVASVLCFFLRPWWTAFYAESCAGILVAYLATALLLGDDPARDSLALLLAPAFILRKLRRSRATLRHARKGAEWVPTNREQPQP